MHWELTPIVVLALLAFGFYQAAKDIKTTHSFPPTEPDLIQEQINSGAAYMTADIVTETMTETVLPRALPVVGSPESSSL